MPYTQWQNIYLFLTDWYLTKKACKITVLQYNRQTDTLRYKRAVRQIRHDDNLASTSSLFQRWKVIRAINICTLKQGLLPCGQRLYIGIMILLPSHSPSVKSAAGNDGSPGGCREGEIPMEQSSKLPFVYFIILISYIKGL